MTPIFRKLVLGLALALVFCLAAPVQGQAAERNAVIAIDNSGTMWNQINGTAKMTIVRDILGTLFDEYEGKISLGLLSYGGKNGTCEDMDALKPIGPISAADYSKALEAHKPKGSSPVAASLGAAKKMFGSRPGSHAIILLTDGQDDCKGDPCATARSLKQKSPETVIHVVAFDALASEKLQGMSCLAEETGGVFSTATSDGELEVALRKALDAVVSGGSRIAGVGPGGSGFGPVPGGVGTPGGSPATSSEPGILGLAAILSQGTQPLERGLIWRLYDGRALDDGTYKLLKTSREARPVLALAPGDYLINGAFGRAHVTKRVTVWPGKRLDDTFNLNAGGLRLYATLAKQPLLSEQGLTFDVFSEETDQFGNRRKVIAGAKQGFVMRLNSGSYRVQSTYGDSNATIEVDVTVEPGKISEATIDHQAGRITFKLVQKAGGEALADTNWTISGEDGALVKKSGGAFPAHVLAAGAYKVKVEHSGREYEAAFSVVPGDRKVVEVVMP